MNWKRYFRIRHFIKCIYFVIRDSYLTKGALVYVPKTMLIVRLEAIGDYIHFRNFLPFVRNSKKFRDYKITLCGNDIWKDLAESYDKEFVDEFIWINRNKLTSDSAYRKSILSQINNKRFEYAVQPNYSREFLWGDSIIRASCAKFRMGSKGDMANDLGVLKWISDKWFTMLIHKNAEQVFEFNRNKIFLEELLEEPIPVKKPVFNLSAKERKDYITLFPGAGEKIKQWSTKNFALWVLEFRRSYLNPIYICGSANDYYLGEEIIKYSGNVPGLINHCGQTNLPQLIEFIQSTALLITNDSSAFHIGAAIDTPTICLLMGRHYGRFAPYPEGTCPNLLTLYPKKFLRILNDKRTSAETSKYNSPASIDDILVKEVMDATIQLLK